MAESPIETLQRFEAHGGHWRVAAHSATEAVVELCTCAGEPVDQLRVTDRETLDYVAGRPRSDAA